MAYILSLETSTRVSSVAIHQQGKLLGTQQLHIDKSHSGLLTVMVDDLLRQCDLSLADMQAVAVSAGPGSYTGLRIGLSTAKGICFGLDKPLISLNTLQVLAESVRPFVDELSWLCPMLDARRMEVYTLLTDKQGNIKSPMQAKVLDELSFEEELKQAVIYFFGSGAGKAQSLLGNYTNARFVEGIEPLASAMGRLAYACYEGEEFADLAYSEPIYLKEFGGKPINK